MADFDVTLVFSPAQRAEDLLQERLEIRYGSSLLGGSSEVSLIWVGEQIPRATSAALTKLVGLLSKRLPSPEARRLPMQVLKKPHVRIVGIAVYVCREQEEADVPLVVLSYMEEVGEFYKSQHELRLGSHDLCQEKQELLGDIRQFALDKAKADYAVRVTD